MRTKPRPAGLLFLALCTVGAPIAAMGSGCSSEAAASPPPGANAAWNTGKVVKDPNYDPRISLAPMLQEVMPAVVSIEAYATGGGLFGLGSGTPALAGSGSGFVLRADGLVATNFHVVHNHSRFRVHVADGRVFEGKVVGTDKQTDVALLQLEGATDLPTVTLGGSEGVAVGDWVIAVGSPLGLDQTVTRGIVSAKGRGSLGLYADGYADFIQTDAAISPGNSGGPLFNLDGEVVGMNTAIAGGMGRGLGFAVPVDQMKAVIPTLKSGKAIQRGWLGVTAKANAPELGKKPTPGAVVDEVHAGTPAASAGIRVGDRIVELDGKPVQDFDDLRSIVGTHGPGESVKLELVRDGKPVELSVTLGDRPDAKALSRLGTSSKSGGMPWSFKFPGSSATPPPAGKSKPSPKTSPKANAHDIFDGGPARLGIAVAETDEGLLVDSVNADSVATRLGLRAGDVIESVNGEPMFSVDDLRAEVGKSRSSIQIRVRRGDAIHTGAIAAQ